MSGWERGEEGVSVSNRGMHREKSGVLSLIRLFDLCPTATNNGVSQIPESNDAVIFHSPYPASSLTTWSQQILTVNRPTAPVFQPDRPPFWSIKNVLRFQFSLHPWPLRRCLATAGSVLPEFLPKANFKIPILLVCPDLSFPNLFFPSLPPPVPPSKSPLDALIV